MDYIGDTKIEYISKEEMINFIYKITHFNMNEYNDETRNEIK